MKKYFILPFIKRPDGSLMALYPRPPLPVTAQRANELFEKFARIGEGATDPLDLLQPDNFVYKVQTIEDDTPDIFDVESFKVEFERRLKEQEEIRQELSQPKEDPDGTWRRQGVLAVK